MSEHENERQYKFTVTLPPRKLRKPMSPETKRALKEFGGWMLCLAAAMPIAWFIGWFIGRLW